MQKGKEKERSWHLESIVYSHTQTYNRQTENLEWRRRQAFPLFMPSRPFYSHVLGRRFLSHVSQLLHFSSSICSIVTSRLSTGTEFCRSLLPICWSRNIILLFRIIWGVLMGVTRDCNVMPVRGPKMDNMLRRNYDNWTKRECGRNNV